VDKYSVFISSIFSDACLLDSHKAVTAMHSFLSQVSRKGLFPRVARFFLMILTKTG
jgi:hypothetical protein